MRSPWQLSTYRSAVAVLIGMALIFGGRANPFRENYVSAVVPILFLVISALWLVLPIRPLLGVVAVCIATSAQLLLLFSWSHWKVLGFVGFASIFGTATSLHLAAILLVGRHDGRLRQVAIAAHLGTVFTVLVGLYLISAGIHFQDLYAGRCLFWFPLAAAVLWINSAVTVWRGMAEVFFILLLAQIGVGLFEIGLDRTIVWMSALALIMWLSAAVLAVYWAKSINATVSNDA